MSTVQPVDNMRAMQAYPLVSVEFMIAQAVGYNVFCFAFTSYMKNREAFSSSLLRPIRNIHNMALALFSGICALLVLYVSYRDGRFSTHDAFHCHPPRSKEYAMLFYLFYLSKLWEMVDTALLIAGKKKVIWLHQLHHTSTLSVVGVVFFGSVAFDILPLFLNLVVHFFMYLYYYNPRGLRALRVVMTSAQIFQFLIVLFYSFWHLGNYYFYNNWACDEPKHILGYEVFWYVAYLGLFVNFFVQQYTSKKNKAEKALKEQ